MLTIIKPWFIFIWVPGNHTKRNPGKTIENLSIKHKNQILTAQLVSEPNANANHLHICGITFLLHHKGNLRHAANRMQEFAPGWFDKSGHWLRMGFNSPRSDKTNRKKHEWPWVPQQHTFVFCFTVGVCVYTDVLVCVPAEIHHKLSYYMHLIIKANMHKVCKNRN